MIKHQSMKVATGPLSVSGTVNDLDFSTINHLQISTTPVDIDFSAGFASFDWLGKAVREKQNRKSAGVHLPFAIMDGFLVQMRYTGALLGVEKTKVFIPDFEGEKTTTLEDVIHHVLAALSSPQQ